MFMVSLWRRPLQPGCRGIRAYCDFGPNRPPVSAESAPGQGKGGARRREVRRAGHPRSDSRSRRPRSDARAPTPIRRAQDSRRSPADVREGLSRHQVSAATGMPRTTVVECLARARAAGVTWPLPDGMDDRALEGLLYRRAQVPPASRRPSREWADVDRCRAPPGASGGWRPENRLPWHPVPSAPPSRGRGSRRPPARPPTMAL
jgi:hypothetical protein